MDHYGYADALRDAVQSLSTKEAQDMLFDCLLSDTQKGELLIRALPTTPPRAVAESFARTMLLDVEDGSVIIRTAGRQEKKL